MVLVRILNSRTKVSVMTEKSECAKTKMMCVGKQNMKIYLMSINC